MSNQKPRSWWEQRRPRYNFGLILSGVLVFFFIFIIEGHKSVNLFALIFQGIASWVFIGFANLFYFLGPLIDKLFNKQDKPVFRERLFNLGFGFSILPPILFATMFIIFPAWDSGYKPLKNIPSDSELYGVYELNSGSKKFLIHQGYNIDSSRLELYSNNKYYFHQLPDNVVNSFGESTEKTINQTGEWKAFQSYGGGYEIVVGGAGYELGKKDNRLSILITIGDPDSREGIVYEKSSKQ